MSADRDVCECSLLEQALAEVRSRVPEDVPCIRCWALDGLAGIMKWADKYPSGLYFEMARSLGTDDVMACGEGFEMAIEALDTIVLTNVHTCAEGRVH